MRSPNNHGRGFTMNGYRLLFRGNDGGEVFSHATPHGRLDSGIEIDASAVLADGVNPDKNRALNAAEKKITLITTNGPH